MSLQVSRCAPRNMASSSEAGSWMTAADLLRLILAAKENAEQLYNSQGATAAACRTLHDAVLACMLFGYLPPVRLSCIRTMTHPKYHGPCLQTATMRHAEATGSLCAAEAHCSCAWTCRITRMCHLGATKQSTSRCHQAWQSCCTSTLGCLMRC